MPLGPPLPSFVATCCYTYVGESFVDIVILVAIVIVVYSGCIASLVRSAVRTYSHGIISKQKILTEFYIQLLCRIDCRQITTTVDTNSHVSRSRLVFVGTMLSTGPIKKEVRI